MTENGTSSKLQEGSVEWLQNIKNKMVDFNTEMMPNCKYADSSVEVLNEMIDELLFEAVFEVHKDVKLNSKHHVNKESGRYGKKKKLQH